ncbi:MAG: hypothetical protein LBG80_07125 [Bacteroidales bacterium]|jgi:hypothetical protein|nr:hypothetical protein [Bacteroidales bacterium]
METKKIKIIDSVKESIWCAIVWHSILLIPAFGLFARNVSVFFWSIYMILLLFHIISKLFDFIAKKNTKTGIKKYYIFFVFLCTLSLFSPIDIGFVPNWKGKDSKQFIAILPIVTAYSGHFQPFRNMRADNKKAFEDYVPYIVSGTNLTYPKYAIVIFYPSQNSPSEPFQLTPIPLNQNNINNEQQRPDQ